MPISNIVNDIKRGVTLTESLLPLIIEVAADAVAAANNPAVLGKFFSDLIKDLPLAVAAVKENNVEVATTAGGVAPQQVVQLPSSPTPEPNYEADYRPTPEPASEPGA